MLDLFSPFGQIKDVRMIKDKNSLNEAMYKSYAFVEFFELENAKKALQAMNKGEISLRNEVLSGNYSTKSDDKVNSQNFNNFGNNNNYQTHVNYIYIIIHIFIE